MSIFFNVALHCSGFGKLSIIWAIITLPKNFSQDLFQKKLCCFQWPLWFLLTEKISHLTRILHTSTVQLKLSVSNCLKWPVLKLKLRTEAATYITRFSNRCIKSGNIDPKIYGCKATLIMWDLLQAIVYSDRTLKYRSLHHKMFIAKRCKVAHKVCPILYWTFLVTAEVCLNSLIVYWHSTNLHAFGFQIHF